MPDSNKYVSFHDNNTSPDLETLHFNAETLSALAEYEEMKNVPIRTNAITLLMNY